MNTKKIILNVLNGYKEPFDKNDEAVKLLAIFSENFEDIADTIVKNLTIPVVIVSVCPNCKEEHTETDCDGYCTAWCLQEAN